MIGLMIYLMDIKIGKIFRVVIQFKA